MPANKKSHHTIIDTSIFEENMENLSGNPLVSIVILTYQHQKYIADCLEGLLSQTYQNMELIIIDDASTDRTVSIINRYASQFEKKFIRFEIICHKVNTGCVAKNINEGVRLCNGEYIKGFAGDDIMLPDCIKNSVRFLENNPEYDLFYGNMYIVSDNWHMGDSYYKNKTFFKRHKPSPADRMLFCLLYEGNYIPAPTIMQRKKTFMKFGFYNEDGVLEDYEYWLRLAGKASFGYLNEKLVLYRRAETSLTNVQNNKHKYITMYNWSVRAMNLHLKNLPVQDRVKCISAYYNRTRKNSKRMGYYDLFFILSIRLYKFRIKRKCIALKSNLEAIRCRS